MKANFSLFIVQLLVWGLAGNLIAGDLDDVLAKLKFRELGPTATGGRIVDIAVHPKRTEIIYAAAASAGLWKTENNGTTWKCVFEREGTTTIGDIAIDPQNPDTIWLGTGEANNQRSSYWGDGIYKSIDAGKTWSNLGLKETHHIGRIVVDPTNSDIVYVAALGHLYTQNPERGLYKTTDGGKTWDKVLYVSPLVGIVDVIVHPGKPEIVLAASYERIRRAWHFDGAGPGSAIYRSADAGATWEKIGEPIPTGEIGRIGLTYFEKNPDVLYASVSNQNPAPPTPPSNQKLEKDDSKSEEDDKKEGESKKTPPGIATPWGFRLEFKQDKAHVSQVDRNGTAARLGIRNQDSLTKLAGRPITSELVLAGVLDQLRQGDSVLAELEREEDTKPRIISLTIAKPREGQVGGHVYRSMDAGKTWEKRSQKPVGGRPAYYYGQIRVDPKDSERVYLLGVPFFHSDDGGANWKTDLARSVHVDHHALWINPKRPRHILLGNDGGFHSSYDRGVTWDHVFNLSLAQFYAIGIDMQRPYWVYGGLQDNGTYAGPSRSRNRSGIGRFEWHKVGGGDGFYSQIDPVEPYYVYAESQFGVVYRLDRRTGQRKSIRPSQSDPEGTPDRFNWNSPILLSKHDRHVVYFGGNKLFRSPNRGDDWDVISPDLTTANVERIAGNVPHCTITTIAESPLDEKILMVGTDDGLVHWSDDRGKQWRKVSVTLPVRPASWWCSRVELSHFDPQTAYVTFTGYREDDFRPFVFVTTDGGKTWKSISSNLPLGPVNVIAEDPRDERVLYVGTEFGVFVSVDMGKNWRALDQGIPRVAVHDLVVHPRDRDLVVGTHARGIFILDDITPLQEFAALESNPTAHLFSLREAVAYRSTATQSISGNRKVLTPNPPYGVIVSYFLQSAQEKDQIKLTVLDRNLKPVVSLKAPAEAGFHRVVWDLKRTSARRFSPAVAPGTFFLELQVGEDRMRQIVEVLEDKPVAVWPVP